MELDFELIAGLVRWTARLSLVLFCLAFAAEAGPASHEQKRRFYLPFVIAHGVHLALLPVYYAALGEWPALSLVLLALAWGLVNYVWVIVTIATRWGRDRLLVVPVYVTWYLWLLFAGTHVLRLFDPARGGAVNAILLGVAVLAAAARIVLMAKAR